MRLGQREEEKQVFKGERTMIGTRDVGYGRSHGPCRIIGGFFRLGIGQHLYDEDDDSRCS